MNQVFNLISSLINNTQPVQQVANIIVLNYAPFVYELSKIIDRQFHDQKSDKKSLSITLVCEILRKSLENNCSRNFVKGLAQRLRYFLHSMSRNYVSEGVALQINRNIDSLKYTGLFCDEYFEKLQTLARKIKQNSGPENSKALQKSQSFEQNQKNYSRTFLTMVNDIKKCGNLKNILQTYNDFVLTEKDNLSKMALKKQKSLDQIHSFRQDQDGKKSVQQINMFQKETRKERLEKIIEECHFHIFDLRRQMGEEVRRFEEGLISVSGRNDFQYKFDVIADEYCQ